VNVGPPKETGTRLRKECQGGQNESKQNPGNAEGFSYISFCGIKVSAQNREKFAANPPSGETVRERGKGQGKASVSQRSQGLQGLRVTEWSHALPGGLPQNQNRQSPRGGVVGGGGTESSQTEGGGKGGRCGQKLFFCHPQGGMGTRAKGRMGAAAGVHSLNRLPKYLEQPRQEEGAREGGWSGKIYRPSFQTLGKAL